MDLVQMDGFDFVFDPRACETCPGHCCCGESGNVWVNPQEIDRICVFLQIHPIDCMERYLQRAGNRFTCKEHVTAQGLECIFFQGAVRKCSIYPVRPSGCRSYPFWEHFKKHPEQLFRECPGVRDKTNDEDSRE